MKNKGTAGTYPPRFRKVRKEYDGDKLPPELEHDSVIEARNNGVSGDPCYQIVFDQHWLPYDYWRSVPDRWEIIHTSVEWHKPDGFMSFLFPKEECIKIVVKADAEAFEL